MYIDGHLDLAFNAVVHKRDLTRPLLKVRKEEQRTAQELLVTLPELSKAGVGIVFGTLFVIPRRALQPEKGGTVPDWKKALSYETAEEAHALGVQQLELYEQWEEEGRVRILHTRADLDAHTQAWANGDRTIGLVVLMEGADPIRTPDDVGWWATRGVRLIGPAWHQTRYAGGTGAPGPLTKDGKALVQQIIAHDLTLDVSHLATRSFFDAMALGPERVVASHSNTRALAPEDRHLSDRMIEAIGASDGIIGMVLGNALVKPGAANTDVTLADVRRHAAHVADLIGWDRVAIGSDFDGGFGRLETPRGISRGADFHKLSAIAPPEARAGVLGGNWLRFLQRVLPT